jgi:hypothetical protein
VLLCRTGRSMAAELACPQIMSTSSATGSNLSWLGISKEKSASLQQLVGHCWRVYQDLSSIDYAGRDNHL